MPNAKFQMPNSGTLSSLLLAVLLALPAVAAKKPAPPAGLPPYGPLKAFPSPRVQEERLANDLTVWISSRRGFPKIALAIAIRGGLAADPAKRPGLSQLLVAAADQGTKTRTARQIAEGFQAAGGDLSGNARPDALLFGVDVLADRAEAAVTLLADVLRNATFPEDEVELAKSNAADSLQAQEAEPDFLARRALARAVFGDHPYRVIAPTQESIAATTAAELRLHYARRFRPDQTLLVAIGDFDPQTLSAAIRKHFGGWVAPSAPPPPGPPRPSAENAHGVFIVERPGSVQTTFAFGAFGPNRRDDDHPAAEVANAIYGGMFSSRLVQNIREDKGYTYSPGASLQTRREAGLLQTRADVRNEVSGASYNEIVYELNRFATTSPAEEELERAKRYLVGSSALSLQSRASVASQLASLWVHGLPPEELGRESEKIQKVTAEQVAVVGKKYFPARRATVIAVGDKKVIETQFAPFGVEIRSAP